MARTPWGGSRGHTTGRTAPAPERPAGQRGTVWTIGHGTRPLDAIAQDLRTNGVTLIVDIRSEPHSRHNPDVSKVSLTETAPELGLGYRWLGDRLGGRPRDPAMWNGPTPDWEAISRSAGFAAGLVELEGLIRAGNVALMCTESSPDNCHRMQLIAPELVTRGYGVVHVLSDGTPVPHHPSLPLGH